jgi:hypothetical protein
MSATHGYLPPATTGANCPGPMTRSALLALRSGGSLSVDCHYVITDHVQGTLAAGTTVTLHAVSSTELSENVEVNTLFDNEAWVGIYDLDASSIIYLRDNRGNEVDGATQVGQFDWGNTSYSYFKVLEGSTLTATIGNPAIKQRVTVKGASTLNLTGFTGTMFDCEISDIAQCNLANTSLTFSGNTVTDGTQFFAQALTAAGASVQRGVFRNSLVTLSGAGVPTIYDTDILSSTATHNSAGALTWATCTFSGSATVTHTGAGAQSLTRCDVASGGRVLHVGAGPITASGCVIEQGAYYQNNGTGTLTATDHTCTGLSSRLAALTAGGITATRGRAEDQGVVIAEQGVITITDFSVRGGVEILPAATAAATIVLDGGSSEKFSKVTNSGAGAITGTRLYLRGIYNNITAQSLVSLSGSATAVTLTDSDFTAGYVFATDGSLTGTRLTIASGGRMQSNAATAVTATDTRIEQFAIVLTQAGSLANVSLNRVNMSSQAAVTAFAGSGGSVFIEDAVLQRGAINKQATSTTGVFRFGQVSAGAAVTTLDGATINIPGTASLYQIVGGTYGRFSTVNFGGDRDVQHISNDIRNTAVINHTGTGGIAGTFLDRIYECEIQRSTVNFTATGATQNSLEATQMLSNSTFNIQGTTTGQRWVRWKLAAFSAATFNNVTATMIHTNTTVWDASTLTYSNGAVAKNLEDNQITSGSVVTVNTPTAAGLIHRLNVFARGTITVSGAVGTVSRSTASAGGVLNFTGGAAHANITASMSGTLTLPFASDNIYHNTTQNTTSTAVNSGRGRDFFNNNIV